MAAINNRRESNFLIKSVKGFDEKFESRGDFTSNRNVTGCSFGHFDGRIGDRTINRFTCNNEIMENVVNICINEFHSAATGRITSNTDLTAYEFWITTFTRLDRVYFSFSCV